MDMNSRLPNQITMEHGIGETKEAIQKIGRKSSANT